MKVWLVRAFGVFALLFAVAISIPDDIISAVDSSPAEIPSKVFQSLVIVLFALVGALIALRRPENALGALFCMAAVAWSMSSFSLDYATHGLVTHPGTLPAADWFGMIGTSLQSVGFYVIFTYLLLLFPTGHLPSPRWRPLFVILSIVLVALTLDTFFGHIANGTRLADVLKNPVELLDPTLSDNISTALFMCLFVMSVLCAISLILRARRATGIERQQIKWIGYAALVCIMFIVFLIFAVFVLNGNVDSIVFSIPVLAIATATGISILRYRLFDIDVIINRTLVYGSLTAVLAGVYFAGVVGAQAVVNLITGQRATGQPAQQSPVLIVVTTLLVAALFQPLRTRLQRFIDRRFYRSRYDTRKTLDKFGASLRSEVELNHLTNSLLETVEQTMHPAHISLWLRERDSRTGETTL